MEQKTYPSLEEVFALYEQAHPKPASVTPSIPQGQQLGTIDKLAQAVIPKLVDKLNEANWQITRLQDVCDYLHKANLDLYRLYNETLSRWLEQQDGRLKALEEKKAPSRRKKKPTEPVVDITEVADYDPDTDTWVAMTVDGHKITGALIETVTHLNGAAGQMYSDELVNFINGLDDAVRAEIAKRFPN